MSAFRMITFGVSPEVFAKIDQMTRDMKGICNQRSQRFGVFMRMVLNEYFTRRSSVAEAHGMRVTVVTCSVCGAVFSGAVQVGSEDCTAKCLTCICSEYLAEICGAKIEDVVVEIVPVEKKPDGLSEVDQQP